MNSNILHAQWASRPDDERFLDLQSLYDKVEARRKTSYVTDVALDALQVQAVPESNEIALVDRRGEMGLLSHWAFGQLCQRAKAPAGYLRTLPSALAVVPLQWSMEMHEGASDESNDAKLLTRENGHRVVAAVTSPTYGRIYDAPVVKAVMDYFDPAIWGVPSASYTGTDPLRATTLYASDRDVFMFLCNEKSVVEVDSKDAVKRGVYIGNSEVGNSKLVIATFLYDRVCDNRIIWGMSDFREIGIRHTSGGPHRFVASAQPQLAAYANAGTSGIAATIRAAKAREVGKDKDAVMDWMKARGFTLPQARKAYAAAEADPRGYNPRSVWGLVQGTTDAAHEIRNTDERVELETRAGKLLDIVATD